MPTSCCGSPVDVSTDSSYSSALLSDRVEGIRIRSTAESELGAEQGKFLAHLEAFGLQNCVEILRGTVAEDHFVGFRLQPCFAAVWTPGFDTTQICGKLGLDTESHSADLEREILVAMLIAPKPLQFANYAELASAIRIRKYIVEAARNTILDFHTTEAERPEDYWRYVDGRGFTLLPGKSLIAALKKATQPEESGTLYSFSCYRATEYVILLGIAQELESCNPELLERLERLWQSRAIMSGEFHKVFLFEYGSLDEPIPLKYFIPGDRTWFRNPDDHSSDVTGYEGSWVMYLGNGLFTNFWKRNQPYTLTEKCVEIFHWRNATWRDQAGELRLDEAIVEKLVAASMREPQEVERILNKMLRLREPPRIYVDGGCIDASREFPRYVCPGTADIALPHE